MMTVILQMLSMIIHILLVILHLKDWSFVSAVDGKHGTFMDEMTIALRILNLSVRKKGSDFSRKLNRIIRGKLWVLFVILI